MTFGARIQIVDMDNEAQTPISVTICKAEEDEFVYASCPIINSQSTLIYHPNLLCSNRVGQSRVEPY